ncbi:uncharacterized protein LOC121387610 [Gigantopelta aegis]|uniref:uncharacterized protein LOC121387610 n=1 Tax=Gigantopelta aegis TaxID=1735272 RepID=UPI001B88A8F2|nr:uncharacterized protein LOC121387610 [Gigantopelta aegis]
MREYRCSETSVKKKRTVVNDENTCGSNMAASRFYRNHEVEDAKTILFDLCYNTESCGRMIKRKGVEKKKNNIHDILNLLHNTEPDDVPCFAAKDLNKLPPILYNHMDMAIILKELEIMKGSIASLQTAQMATAEICRSTFQNKKDCACSVGLAVDVSQENDEDTDIVSSSPVNDCVHDSGLEAETVTPSDINILKQSQNVITEKEDGELDDSITHAKQLIRNCKTPNRQSSPVRPDEPLSHVTREMSQHTGTARSFADMAAGLASNGMELNREKKTRKAVPHRSGVDSEGFKFVGPKRKKPVVIGTAQSSALRGVKSTPVPVFVTRLAPGTKESDILDYVRSVLGIDVWCEKLRTRYDTYSSFKILVDSKNIDKLMSPNVWPEEVLVRKFYVIRH